MKVPRTVLACAAAGAVVFACYGPTEVRLSFSTDLGCTNINALITVGEQQTEANKCIGGDGQLGDLVVVPSGARDGRVTVEAVLATNGVNPVECADPKKKAFCVVARRTFRFIEHTARTLPIALRRDCLGMSCDDPSTTCEHASCVSSDVEVTAFEGEIPAADGGPPEAGADPADPPDAGEPDAPSTAPRSCPGETGTLMAAMSLPRRGRIFGNNTALYWVTDAGEVVRFEKKAKTAPIVVGDGIAVAVTDDELIIARDVAGVFSLERRALPPGGSLAQPCPVTEQPELLAIAPGLGVHVVSTVQGGGTAVWRLSSFGPCSEKGPAQVTPALDLFSATNATYMLHAQPLGLRAYPPAMPVDASVVASSHATAAASDTLGAFFAESVPGDAAGTRVRMVGDSVPRALLARAPTQLALDKGSVYWVDVDTAAGRAAVYRVPRAIATPTAVPELVASGFTMISGIVSDGTCVYFWGTPADPTHGPPGLHGVAAP